MNAWSVRVSADRFAAERLYHHELLSLPSAGGIRPGDRIALVADIEPPVVFALAVVDMVARGNADDPSADDPSTGGPSDEDALFMTYTHRFFDDPMPAPDGDEISLDEIERLATASQKKPKSTWLVSIDLPVEATSAAEAVRQFWSYVRELGPAELPVFVSPSDDELAMQAFVLGEEANQDPED